MSTRPLLTLVGVAALTGCFMTRWELRDGGVAAPLCPGATTDVEATNPCPAGVGASGLDGALLSSEAAQCSPLLSRFSSVWEGCTDYLFRFDTDEQGVPVNLCVTSTTFSPDYVTCLADKLQKVRFDPNMKAVSYRVRFVVD
jgi:hypothetical protein